MSTCENNLLPKIVNAEKFYIRTLSVLTGWGMINLISLKIHSPSTSVRT